MKAIFLKDCGKHEKGTIINLSGFAFQGLRSDGIVDFAEAPQKEKKVVEPKKVRKPRK
jgi:hypothetical protein